MTARRQERDGFCRRCGLIGLMVAAVWPLAPQPADAATTERVVVDRLTGLAIGGIDPVAYFTEGRAAAGKAELEASQAGAVWRFRNDHNREFFLAHPEIYGPQFGGYDPVDVARGVTVAGRPQFWLIAGQRLYLFAREDNRDAFAADPAAVLREARQRWPGLRDTLAR
ncbi:MAG TPA: YHS domain-containing (seleno)protein [Xanthobacteraceae bacterium]|nr:YHS domain-containing (seleno)protein [Xanthobacteraceae bacterium]